jgi:hypothetical protein
MLFKYDILVFTIDATYVTSLKRRFTSSSSDVNLDLFEGLEADSNPIIFFYHINMNSVF